MQMCSFRLCGPIAWNAGLQVWSFRYRRTVILVRGSIYDRRDITARSRIQAAACIRCQIILPELSVFAFSSSIIRIVRFSARPVILSKTFRILRKKNRNMLNAANSIVSTRQIINPVWNRLISCWVSSIIPYLPLFRCSHLPVMKMRSPPDALHYLFHLK